MNNKLKYHLSAALLVKAFSLVITCVCTARGGKGKVDYERVEDFEAALLASPAFQ